jgi:serine/threonine protein kinase
LKHALSGSCFAECWFGIQGTLTTGHSIAENALTLESSVKTLAGEEKRLFLNFVQRMLRWMPEDRATAGQLLGDPWFNAKRWCSGDATQHLHNALLSAPTMEEVEDTIQATTGEKGARKKPWRGMYETSKEKRKGEG